MTGERHCFLCKKPLVIEGECKHHKSHIIQGHCICKRCIHPIHGRVSFKSQIELLNKIKVEELLKKKAIKWQH